MIPYEESYVSICVEESKDKVAFTMKRSSITTNSFMIQDLSMRTHQGGRKTAGRVPNATFLLRCLSTPERVVDSEKKSLVNDGIRKFHGL